MSTLAFCRQSWKEPKVSRSVSIKSLSPVIWTLNTSIDHHRCRTGPATSTKRDGAERARHRGYDDASRRGFPAEEREQREDVAGEDPKTAGGLPGKGRGAPAATRVAGGNRRTAAFGAGTVAGREPPPQLSLLLPFRGE
jgi:hypothetical protein